MKNLKHFVFFLFFTIVSCSTDSKFDPVEIIAPFEENFEISVNGQLLDTIVDVYQIEDTFTFKIFPESVISFNKNGNFGFVYLDLHIFATSGTKDFYSFANYSSNYFTLNIEELDEVKRTIKGSFSGTIYSNAQDLSSEGKYISGTFAKKYTLLAPVFSNLKNAAKIDGNQWFEANRYLTKGVPTNANIVYHSVSDDEYKIMIKYDESNINVGTYNFSETTATNAIQLSKFDVATEQYINYKCIGILNIVQKENIDPSGSQFILKGNYSFTAINPNNPADIINVTEGNFKLFHTYFH